MKGKKSILVVDDDVAHRTMLRALLSGWGYEIREADSGEAAVEAVKDGPFDLILMDVRMIRMSGIEAMSGIKALNPSIPVIIMTAFASVETAVEALKKGAYDYLTKPLDFDELHLAIERAMDHLKLREENRLLRESLGARFDRRNLIARSAAMERLLETVAQVAPSEATVLVTGESGTGKEMIAGAIHFNSFRKDGPFIKINCAAIAETLLESELFGHEKGAFTGADRQKAGRVELAHTGTLFIDEIGDVPFSAQVKLLRVLQEKIFTRVGGTRSMASDFRLVAATNRDLVADVAAGRFRQDLYYRLNVVPLVMPPLRERGDDIVLLARDFLGQYARKYHRVLPELTKEDMATLMSYPWPGNVRELKNVMERTAILSSGNKLSLNLPALSGPAEVSSFADRPTMDDLQRRYISHVLDLTGGRIGGPGGAAEVLGMKRTTLQARMKKLGIS